jgi:hypothetical protein
MRNRRGTAERILQAGVLLLSFLAFSMGVWQAASAETRATFLIVEDPSALVVYDAYRQTVGASGARALGSFVPLRIINDREYLSDGFTPCVQVNAAGRVFYLLSDANGQPVGIARAGVTRIVHGAIPFSDTVEILAVHGLPLRPPKGDSPTTLQRGDKILRVFSEGTSTYVRRIAGDQSYGWVTFAETGLNREWRVLTSSTAARPVISALLLQNIQEKLTKTNTLYEHLFAVLNRQTGARKTSPLWHMTSTKESIVCTLDSPLPANDFQRSTAALARDLESISLGSGLKIFTSDGKIELR